MLELQGNASVFADCLDQPALHAERLAQKPHPADRRVHDQPRGLVYSFLESGTVRRIALWRDLYKAGAFARPLRLSPVHRCPQPAGPFVIPVVLFAALAFGYLSKT